MKKILLALLLIASTNAFANPAQFCPDYVRSFSGSTEAEILTDVRQQVNDIVRQSLPKINQMCQAMSQAKHNYQLNPSSDAREAIRAVNTIRLEILTPLAELRDKIFEQVNVNGCFSVRYREESYTAHHYLQNTILKYYNCNL